MSESPASCTALAGAWPSSPQGERPSTENASGSQQPPGDEEPGGGRPSRHSEGWWPLLSVGSQSAPQARPSPWDPELGLAWELGEAGKGGCHRRGPALRGPPHLPLHLPRPPLTQQLWGVSKHCPAQRRVPSPAPPAQQAPLAAGIWGVSGRHRAFRPAGGVYSARLAPWPAAGSPVWPP